VHSPTWLNAEAPLTISELQNAFKVSEEILKRVDAVFSGTFGGWRFLGGDDFEQVLKLVAKGKQAESDEVERIIEAENRQS